MVSNEKLDALKYPARMLKGAPVEGSIRALRVRAPLHKRPDRTGFNFKEGF
jgi:hypothetical protein